MINLQSPGPIGLGELANLPDGNSILTLKDKNGQSVNHKLWIDDFTSDLNMQIDITQLRSGYSYRPIRIQERTLTFTTIWSLANRPKYEALVEAIREHWAYNLNELIPTPVYFTYFGANKTWAGFILNASRTYAVPDTLLSYSFDMKLINSQVNEYMSNVSMYSYYVPRPENISINGIDGWYAITDLLDKEESTTEEPTTEEPTTSGSSNNGVYVTKNWNSPSTVLLPSGKTVDSYPTDAEYRAAIIWWYVVKHELPLEEAILQADLIMDNQDRRHAERDAIWNQVYSQPWEQYLNV